MAAKFNRNTIAKQVEVQADLYGDPSGMDKKEKSIMVRLPEEMANKYKLILAKIGSNPSVKTRELIYEYINNYERKRD